MTRSSTAVATSFVLLLAAAVPAWAASSTSSAASDSASTSVGSISNSFERSSDSSSKKNVAQGDYRIIEMADAPARPGFVRLKLQALADAGPRGEFFLLLPQAAADQSRLAPGHVVSARQRGYGMEFSKAETKEAFFLVLTDEVYRELQTNKVVSL